MACHAIAMPIAMPLASVKPQCIRHFFCQRDQSFTCKTHAWTTRELAVCTMASPAACC
jgi:hypothetical protein